MQGKVVLITGAARRVGAAIAKACHAQGAQVMLHYRASAASAVTLRDELNSKRENSAAIFQADLLDIELLPSLVLRTVEVFGRLDALVNNASTFYATPFASIHESDWTDLIDSNLKAPLFLSQAAAPYLKQTLGSIVNITDIHAERPLKGYLTYSVAKAGLMGLTAALARELAPEVRVNAVAPGAILWPEDGQFEPAERERILSTTPLRREGSAEDIARAVTYLIREGHYITGQTLRVDGGRSVFI